MNKKELKDTTIDVEKIFEKIKKGRIHFLDEAVLFKKIMDAGYTQGYIANKLVKQQTTISNKVRLLKLQPEVQQAIKENKLSEKHCRFLLRLTSRSQQITAVKHIVEYNLSINETEEYIEKTLIKGTSSGDANDFLKMIVNGVGDLKNKGVPIKGRKRDTGEYIEITVRLYNKGA